jgi:hypothetical protein
LIRRSLDEPKMTRAMPPKLTMCMVLSELWMGRMDDHCRVRRQIDVASPETILDAKLADR